MCASPAGSGIIPSGVQTIVSLDPALSSYWITAESQGDGMLYKFTFVASDPQTCGTVAGVMDRNHITVTGGQAIMMNPLPVMRMLGTDFGACMWVRTTSSASGVQHIFTVGKAAVGLTGSAIEFGYSSGKIMLTGYNAPLIATGTAYQNGDKGKWVHYCFSFGPRALHQDGSRHQVWRNKVLIMDKGAAVDYVVETLEEMVFGQLARTINSQAWTGDLDEFRLYSRMITTDEVTTAFDTGVYPLTNLEIFYPFSETSGTKVHDYSGNERHWIDAIALGISRASTGSNSKCINKPAPLALRNVQLQRGDNAPIFLNQAFQTATNSYTATVTLDPVAPSVPSQSIGNFASSCSQKPVWPLLDPTSSCINVPVGRNCSFTCANGQQLVGGPMTCQSNGEFTSQGQVCLVPTNFVPRPSSRTVRDTTMAWCARSNTLYEGGGVDGSGADVTLPLLASDDGGITWRDGPPITALGSCANCWGAVSLFCDANDVLHAFGPLARSFQWDGTAWLGPINMPASASPQATVRVASVMVPSSGFMDYLIIGGSAGDPTISSNSRRQVWRFYSAQQAFGLVCDAAPWRPVNSASAVYANERTLLLIGGISGDVNSATQAVADVWRSADDGATWTMVLGSPSRPNTFFGARYGMIAFAYGGSAYVGFGNVALAGTVVLDLWQSYVYKLAENASFCSCPLKAWLIHRDYCVIVSCLMSLCSSVSAPMPVKPGIRCLSMPQASS
jgi:hypothetical protein